MAKRPIPKQLEKFRFKKGVSGNPEGGRKHDPELRKLRNLTKEEMVEIGSLIVKGDIAELERLKNAIKKVAKGELAPKVPVLQAMMASVALKTIATGDANALDILLNRLVGRVPANPEDGPLFAVQINNQINAIPSDVAERALKELEEEL